MSQAESRRFLDPDKDIQITHRRLPHWDQGAVTYFVAYRTADSLPSPVLVTFKAERAHWFRDKGLAEIPEDFSDIPSHLQHEYRETFTHRYDEFMDSGHGACPLRRSDVQNIITGNLHFKNGIDYQLNSFVIMPNHIHILVQMLGVKVTLKQQCFRWKKFTAGKINTLLGRSGHFWSGESYDRIVRDEGELLNYREYLRQNPAKARLREGDYVLWEADV